MTRVPPHGIRKAAANDSRKPGKLRLVRIAHSRRAAAGSMSARECSRSLRPFTARAGTSPQHTPRSATVSPGVPIPLVRPRRMDTLRLQVRVPLGPSFPGDHRCSSPSAAASRSVPHGHGDGQRPALGASAVSLAQDACTPLGVTFENSCSDVPKARADSLPRHFSSIRAS